MRFEADQKWPIVPEWCGSVRWTGTGQLAGLGRGGLVLKLPLLWVQCTDAVALYIIYISYISM